MPQRPDSEAARAIPWMPSEAAPNRVPPRECVAAARAALDKTYAYTDAPIPLLVEALDWLRRALEQMAPESAQPEEDRTEAWIHSPERESPPVEPEEEG